LALTAEDRLLGPLESRPVSHWLVDEPSIKSVLKHNANPLDLVPQRHRTSRPRNLCPKLREVVGSQIFDQPRLADDRDDPLRRPLIVVPCPGAELSRFELVELSRQEMVAQVDYRASFTARARLAPGVKGVPLLVVQVDSRLPIRRISEVIPLALDILVQAAAWRLIAEREVPLWLPPAHGPWQTYWPLSALLPMKYT